MIQPLRTVHRRVFITLALMLPTIVLVGLGARRPRPRPVAQVAAVPASAYLVRESGKLWHKHSIRSAFYSDANNPKDMYVVLRPTQELHEPDLLLYWAGAEPQGKQKQTAKTVSKCHRGMSAEAIGGRRLQNIARIAVANREQIAVRVDTPFRHAGASRRVKNDGRFILCCGNTLHWGGCLSRALVKRTYIQARHRG